MIDKKTKRKQYYLIEKLKKEIMKDLEKEIDKRFKLYDITIKNLMDKLKKYEPSVEGLDN